MKKINIAVFIACLAVIGLMVWYLDPFHKPVESVSKLVGKDYKDALNYFGSQPSSATSFNIRDDLTVFQGEIRAQTERLQDSIINQYTWKFTNYKVTVWVGRTKHSDKEIIDAIRYKNNVVF